MINEYNSQWYLGIEKEIYYGNADARAELIQRLESEAGKQELGLTDKVFLNKALGLALDYSGQGEKAKERFDNIIGLELPEGLGEEKVLAAIMKADVFRRSRDSESARNLIDAINPDEIQDSAKKIQYHWVSALLNADKLSDFTSHTKAGIECFSEYEKLSTGKDRSILAEDRAFCFSLFRVQQCEREGLSLKWEGKQEEAQQLFDEAGSLVSKCLVGCKQDVNVQGNEFKKFQGRKVDAWLHGALFNSFIDGSSKDSSDKTGYERAEELIQRAKETGVGYVDQFARLVKTRSSIARGEEPKELKPISLNTYAEEDKSWRPFEMEIKLELLKLFKKNFKGDQLVKKVDKLVPPESVKFLNPNIAPEELKSGVAILKKEYEGLVPSKIKDNISQIMQAPNDGQKVNP